MTKPVLIVLCGLPGAGKSTFARLLVDQFDALVVCGDSLVAAVHGGAYIRYREELKPLYGTLEENILTYAMRIRHPLIVIDRTCVKSSTRSRHASLASKEGYTPVLVCFSPGNESLLKRVQRRMLADSRGLSHEKWVEVSKKLLSELEIPLPRHEGFKFAFDSKVALPYIRELLANVETTHAIQEQSTKQSELQPSLEQATTEASGLVGPDKTVSRVRLLRRVKPNLPVVPPSGPATEVV